MSLTTLTKIKIDNLEDDGKVIYHNNEVIKDLANVMEHPLSRDFFNKYFKNWADAEAMIMFMKTYERIEELGDDLTPFAKISILDKTLNRSDTRQLITQEMIKWKDDNKIQSKIL
jgi:hemerythrin superfamily protein